MIRRLEEKLRFVKYRAGSALVLVIVITVLLATVGVMFVMMARVSQVATSAIADNRDLSAAVDVVVNRIQTILVQDLFGNRIYPSADVHLFAHSTDPCGRPNYSNLNIVNEPWDAPTTTFPVTGFRDDPWLASLEPVEDPCSISGYSWPHISDLYGSAGHLTGSFPHFGIPLWLQAKIDPAHDANDFVIADADGDGVTDSRWIPLHRTSSKGRPIFAAVRIIDNCAMLNLNTAHTANPCSEGEYLSSVDYERFLRGSDATPGVPGDPDNIRRARMADGIIDPCDPCDSYQHYHDDVIMNIENPGPAYSLFDIGDELEIRNRYLLTSPVEARFERHDVANYTLDAGGGTYGALEIPRTTGDFDEWKWRMDHRNFEDPDPPGSDSSNPEPYKYDRRHVCTFYSFDRNLRRRTYPLVDVINDMIDPNRIDWRLGRNPVFTPGSGVPVNVSNIGVSDPLNPDPSARLAQRREIRRHILYLLYAFRAYFLDMDPDAGYQAAARRSAQLVANMIDYIDDNNPTTEGPFFDSEPYDYGGQRNDNPTYINRDIIRELILEVSTYYHDILGIGNVIDIDIQTEYDFGLSADDIIYGYERQPFISELYCSYDSEAPTPGVQAFAIELCSPYDSQLDLDGWNIRIGSIDYPLDINFEILPVSSTSPGGLERLVIRNDTSVPAIGETEEIPGFGTSLLLGNIVQLQLPDPANTGEFITVDATEPEQITFFNGVNVSKRDDTAWRFTDAGSYIVTTDPCNVPTPTLGEENQVAGLSANGFQMPVANNNESLATLSDFEMILSIGSERIGEDPNAITRKVGSATSEGDVRFDVESRPELLEYICFMNRWQGNLPGRININTATMEVIRAAIPPNLDWDADNLAMSIINDRIANGPFERVSDLLDVQGFTQMMSDPNSGDPIIGDFEDRDWILSRVANIFTVRSDVFTAYILVRIGHDGPQKRMIAIFDRSNVFSPEDRPRLVALHPTPDPR